MLACAAPFHILDLLPFVGAAGASFYFLRCKIRATMQKMFPTLLVFLLMVTGCANAWKTAYVGGAVSADYVTDLHKQAWSEPLNARAEECDAKLDPETDTKEDFDSCMAEFALVHQEKVEAGLVAYNAAAEVLEKVLLAADPENPKPDRDQLISAWTAVLTAALELVQLFPGGDKYVAQLRTLTKGL